jgi:hypothetical protein
MAKCLADVEYHPYVALLCYLDSEWSRKKPLTKEGSSRGEELIDSLASKQKRFNDICAQYRSDISMNFAKFNKATQAFSNSSAPGGPLSAELASYLYEPLNYFTFGHSDNLSIVLLDDFDPVQHITSAVRTTIENIELAFCPKMKSLALEDLIASDATDHLDADVVDKRDVLSMFAELEELLDCAPDANGRSGKLAIMDRMPFLAFTRFKMSVQGILFQQAVYRAMARKIMNVLIRLKEVYDSEEDHDLRGLFPSLDFRSLRIAFLDLQGIEEIGTLIFCKNNSLAMTVVALLRSLTFGDLFREDPTGELRNSLDQELLWSLNLEIAKGSRLNRAEYGLASMDANHVFRWTHTSVSVSPEAFSDPIHSSCEGFVQAMTEMQISPGHRSRADARVKISVDGDTRTLAPSRPFHLYCVGVTDYIFQNMASAEDRNPKHLLPVVSMLRILKENLTTFGTLGAEPEAGRDVIDILTRIAVPVPSLVYRSGRQAIFEDFDPMRHFSFISESLSIIKDSLCYNSNQKENHISEQIGANPGKLDIPTLKAKPRLYGLPVSLRRSIEFLFQNFAALISDPYLFDSVLDQYEMFATLHALLTSHLPAQLESERQNSAYPIYLDQRRIKQLSDLVEAIHNAASHRMLKAYPEEQKREMAIDFRGGLNQMLYSADAVLKCGLSLLRRIAYEHDDGAAPKRSSVGGIIKIGFEPGARCFPLAFGTEDKAKLAYFELDVPHVFHVAGYCDNLHETFHLIFDVLYKTDAFAKELYEIEDEVSRVRVSELFAHLLCQLLIFGEDIERALYFQICNHLKSPVSIASNNAATIVRLTEILFRIFMVLDFVSRPDRAGHDNGKKNRKAGKQVDEALGRFKVMIGKARPLLGEYDLHLQDEGVQSYLWKQFVALYPENLKYMTLLWPEVKCIHEEFFDGWCASASTKKSMREAFSRSLQEGRPLIRKLFLRDISEFQGLGARVERDDGRYSMMLICGCLYEYVPDPKTSLVFQKRVHSFRHAKTRDIQYNEADWYEFQIDRGAAQMFCPVPAARAARLRKQISILKTFWDISAYQREKVLKRIIDDNWSPQKRQ